MTKANTNATSDCEPLSETESERLDKNFTDFIDRVLEWSTRVSFDESRIKPKSNEIDEFDDSDREDTEMNNSCFNPYLEEKLLAAQNKNHPNSRFQKGKSM